MIVLFVFVVKYFILKCMIFSLLKISQIITARLFSIRAVHLEKIWSQMFPFFHIYCNVTHNSTCKSIQLSFDMEIWFVRNLLLFCQNRFQYMFLCMLLNCQSDLVECQNWTCKLSHLCLSYTVERRGWNLCFDIKHNMKRMEMDGSLLHFQDRIKAEVIFF